jgi:cytochrome bd-type quinol oxidase subunit 2
MIHKIKMILISLGLVSTLGLLPAVVVHADAASDACDGIKLVDPTAKCNDAAAGQSGFTDLTRKVINVFSIVIGAVSVIMIIIGGFRYVISGGDSSATKSAKDTIMYAVIGLVVVLFAQVIVVFVLTNTKPAPASSTAPKTSKPK